MEILQSLFIATNRTSLCNVWWRDTHVNEFVGVWQSSQWLQLNCHLNVKITNHSNAMKLKTVDSIAVVVTLPLFLRLRLLLLQHWMANWRTFMKFYLLKTEPNSAHSLFVVIFILIFIDHSDTEMFNKNAYSWLNFIAANPLYSPLWAACTLCCCVFKLHIFVMIHIQMWAWKRLIENQSKHLHFEWNTYE